MSGSYRPLLVAFPILFAWLMSCTALDPAGREVATPGLAAGVVAAVVVILGLTLFGVLADRRMRARTAESAAMRKWRQVFENASWGIRLGSPDGSRVEAVNPAFARMHGYSASELLDLPIERLYPPEHRSEFAMQLARANAEGRATYATVHLRKNGSTFPALVDMTVVRDDDGRVLTHAVHVQDLSARAEAETALRTSEERYRVISETASDAMVTIDAASTILHANRATERIFGHPAETLIGRNLELLMPEYLREVHNAAIARYTRTGERHVNWESIELVGLHADGHEIPLEVSFGESRQGEAHIFTGIIRDITERRAAEERLRESEERLRQAEKMEAVGRLAGGIAHDFNNQLTAILGFTHLLLAEAEDGRQQHDLEEVRKAAERAASLTQQLLAFSRKQVLQPRVLDLNTIVADLEPMLARLIGEHIHFETRLTPRLGRVRADAGQLEQAIVNLVLNARDAMPDGGRLTIETANVRFAEEALARHFALPRGRYVVVAVSDTGIGMDADTRSRIFEPFFTTKEVGRGTGLGLPSVYGSVTQSGGHVAVHSEPGLGSTFKIYLPVAEGEPIPAAEAASEDLPGGRETVLLVEDDDAVRALVRETLEAYGYRVLVAANGAEALDVAARQGALIHLLLTDVVMPEMDGRTLVERLGLTHPETKVLVMSGYSEAMVEHQVCDPDSPFLRKPFSADDLLRTTRAVLDAVHQPG